MSYILETFIFVLMKFFTNTFLFKRIAILISFLIVSLILWNTYTFFQKFKVEERAKMEIFATAQRELSTNTDLNASVDLQLKIIKNSRDIPMILVNEFGEIEYNNLDSIKGLDQDYVQDQLKKMKSENQPVEISYQGINKKFIYFKRH